MQTTYKPLAVIVSSAALLGVAAFGMLTIGTAQIPVETTLAVVLHNALGLGGSDITSADQTIIWHIRWQRVALDMIVGNGLAVAGACFQTMFRNPLADPYVLGVSSGAALGAALSMVMNRTELMIPLAFGGAMTSLAVVWCFGYRDMGSGTGQHLLLAGIACGALFNAVLSATMALHSQMIQMIVFWLMGSLSGYPGSLLPVLIIVLAGLAVALAYARDLDVMALGDDEARFLGVEVNKVKLYLLVSATLMTGSCVAVSGTIGFIGLIVPHLVRKLTGPQHLLILPLSAIFGALFLLVADGTIRFFPVLSAIPVGVVTAMFGSPFFLYVLYSAGRRTL